MPSYEFSVRIDGQDWATFRRSARDVGDAESGPLLETGPWVDDDGDELDVSAQDALTVLESVLKDDRFNTFEQTGDERRRLVERARQLESQLERGGR